MLDPKITQDLGQGAGGGSRSLRSRGNRVQEVGNRVYTVNIGHLLIATPGTRDGEEEGRPPALRALNSVLANGQTGNGAFAQFSEYSKDLIRVMLVKADAIVAHGKQPFPIVLLNTNANSR
jgi:hypothetical protein